MISVVFDPLCVTAVFLRFDVTIPMLRFQTLLVIRFDKKNYELVRVSSTIATRAIALWNARNQNSIT